MGLSDQSFEELLAAMAMLSTAQRLKLKRALDLEKTPEADTGGAPSEAASYDGKLYPDQGTGVLPPPKPRGRLAMTLADLPEYTDEEVDRMELAIAESKASWNR